MPNNEEILKSIHQTVEQNIKSYGHLFNERFNWSLLDSIRDEICTCLITGCSQASITLTNHLLEKSLKIFLFHVEPTSQNYTDAEEIEKHFKEMNRIYGGKDLSDTINNCCSKGLITREQKNILHGYRDQFRNAFGHAEPNKIFGQTEKEVIVFNPFIHSKVPEPVKVKVADFPFLHDHQQKEIAEENCGKYFEYVDRLIKSVLPKLFKMPSY